MSKKNAGISLIEIVITIAIVGILASAFSSVMVPLTNNLFHYPQNLRVSAAAADLVQIILDGDDKAKGLRYTGLPCAIGGTGGGSTVTAASASGDTSTLTYHYVDADYCGSGAARISRTVTLTYDRSIGTVTRSIDGGTARNIPDHVTTGSDINYSVSGGGTDLFKYYDKSGTDLGASPIGTTIAHVQNVGTNSSKTDDTTLTVAVPVAGVAAGNLLVVYFAMDDAQGAVMMEDTQANSYRVAVDRTFTGNVRTLILYSEVKTALASGNTIRITYPRCTAKAVSIHEFSGLDALELTASATGTSTSPSSGNVTTTVAASLLVGAIGVEGPSGDSFTAGGSYTAGTRVGTTGGADDTNITINPEYRIVSATGTYAGDGTITSRDWSALEATFYGSNIYRVDVDVIASSGSGQVKHNAAQTRIKSGADLKRYLT